MVNKVNAEVTHNEVNGGVESLLNRLEDLEKRSLYVGVPKSTTMKRDGGELEIANAELMYIHTHGVRKIAMRKAMDLMMKAGSTYSEAYQMYLHSNGSALYAVPPRPVIGPALKAHREEIGKGFQRIYKAAADGNEAALKTAINWTGMKAQNACRDWFYDARNGWPKNAPRTIKVKGSERPLINTGSLRNSIIYVVRGE